jgi:glycosyltransferase involved in cell wall biosynthesis
LRKKVAIVITRMDLGGAQELALESAARMDGERFEVTLLAGPGGSLDAAAEKRLGGRFVKVAPLKHPISPLNDIKAFFWLFRYFVRERPYFVHTHSSKAGLLARAAAWASGVPRILHTVHGWSFHDFMKNPKRNFFIQLEKSLASVSDALCVVARSCQDKGLFNQIGEPHQYHLLRAGVDLAAWRGVPRSRDALKKAGLPVQDSDIVVGCIANCKEQKNPADFVRTAALVLKEAAQARFVYIGDGPLRPQAEGLARELGISERVHFLGWMENPKDLAAGFDIFLLTSLWEGLPCVFPQVLSMGIPVVATNVDGAPEIIREGKNGYLCIPKDINSLADRAILLLKDEKLRKSMSESAKDHLTEEFDFSDMIKQTERIYAELA